MKVRSPGQGTQTISLGQCCTSRSTQMLMKNAMTKSVVTSNPAGKLKFYPKKAEPETV